MLIVSLLICVWAIAPFVSTSSRRSTMALPLGAIKWKSGTTLTVPNPFDTFVRMVMDCSTGVPPECVAFAAGVEVVIGAEDWHATNAIAAIGAVAARTGRL